MAEELFFSLATKSIISVNNNNGLRHRDGKGGSCGNESSTSPTTVMTTAFFEEEKHYDEDENQHKTEDQDPASTITTTTTSPAAAAAVSVSNKTALERLFSAKEERYYLHAHKILGISCLVSFAYRLTNLGKPDGHFGPNLGTLAFILLHFLLNASAFIFDIPKRRIRDGGYRIWPEYRIHSLVFASRSLAFIGLRYLEQSQSHGSGNGNGNHNTAKGLQLQGQLSRYNYWYMDLIIVLGTCALADVGSYLQKEYHSNTVRDATFSDPFENHFASEMQLFLTSFCIVGYRRYTIHLLALFNIQLNSFLMTLRRKNVAPQWVLTATYSLMLVMSGILFLMDDKYSRRVGMAGAVGSIAVILRMQFQVNKYILWTGLWVMCYLIRTYHIRYMYNQWMWFYMFLALRLVCTMIGMKKRQRQAAAKGTATTTSPVVGFMVYALHMAFFGYVFYMNRRHIWRQLFGKQS